MDPVEITETTMSSKVEEEETKEDEEVINAATATAEHEDIAGAVGLFSPGEKSVDKGALSPLTGSYLLIVLAEPHSEEDREIIIKRLTKGYDEEIKRAMEVERPKNITHFKEKIDENWLGEESKGKSGVPYWYQRWPYVMPIQIDKRFGLRSWDVDSTHVDLSCELLNLANAAPEGDEARNGEKLVQWASENLVVEVLIHCQVNTLLQCMKNLLSSFTRHRHIIHAGYTFQGTGSWILQDGTFSFTDFVELWEEPEVTRILGAYRGDISVSMHCSEENGWTDDRLGRESFTKLCQVRMNPPELLLAHSSGVITFVDYISKLTAPATLKEILEPSEIVGNIRFSRPTLYVFPGGQGDAALFGVNGFNMLIDGGFSRRSCFWDFTRHLDRLDAVLLTRVNNNAVGGLDSVLDRKRLNQVYPQIGHFFGNVMERKHPEMEKTGDPEELLVSLTETGQRMLDNLRSINIRPQHCFRDHTIEPINLYHKVGHGKLDMYVLNPAKDSREVREFLSKWNTDCKSFVQARMSVKVEGKERNYPVLNLVSICALLVWQPDNPRDPITRILFPGSTPQQKIFEALGKLKHLEFLKYPVCSAKTIAASHKSRVKSEKIVSEAKSQFSTSGIVKDKSGNGEAITRTPAQRAPSESRVSSKYAYGAVRSKVSSSTRSDSSSTIQTITGETTTTATSDKERKGRERSREKRKVTSTAKSIDRDNKAVESEGKKTERVSSSRRVDTGLSKTSSTAKVSSSTTSKVSSSASKVTSRIDTGKKSGQVSGVTSPPSKDLKKEATETSITKTGISKTSSGVPSSKYGIGVARTVVSKVSAGSTASPPPTPPKSAKEATNRKVIEHKTQTTRKSLIDSSKSKDKVQAGDVIKKSTSSSTSSSMTKSSSLSAKSTIPRPATAVKKTSPNEPVAVKRPSTAGSKAAAAIGLVAAAGAGAAVAAALTSSEDKEDHNGTNGHTEAIDKDSGGFKDDVTDEIGSGSKSPVEIEIVDQNGLGLSVPVTESSSELSSLEHVSVTDDLEDNGATGSEEMITELYNQDHVGTSGGGDMQSETHTITEPCGDNYDEEDEYLIIEKDESAGAEEINIDSNITADENVKDTFDKEDYHSPEKEVDEEKDVDEFAEDNKESVDENKEIEDSADEIKDSMDKESVDQIKESAEKESGNEIDSTDERKKSIDKTPVDQIKESAEKDSGDEIDEVIEKSKAYTDDQEVPDEIAKSSTELQSEEEIPEPEKSRKDEIPDFESGIEMSSVETIVTTEQNISEPEKEVRGLRDEVEVSSQLSDRLSAEREDIPPPGKTILDQPEESEKRLPEYDEITEKEIIPDSGDFTTESSTADNKQPIDEKEEIPATSELDLNQDNDEIKKLEEVEISNLSKSPVPAQEELGIHETLVKEQQASGLPSDDKEEELPLTPQPSFETEELTSEDVKSMKPEISEAQITKAIEIDQESIKSSVSQEQIEDTDIPETDVIESKQSTEAFQSSPTVEPSEVEALTAIKDEEASVIQEPETHRGEILSDDKRIGDKISESKSEIQPKEFQGSTKDSIVLGNDEELAKELIKSSESVGSAETELKFEKKSEKSGSSKSDDKDEEAEHETEAESALLPQFPEVPTDDIPILRKDIGDSLQSKSQPESRESESNLEEKLDDELISVDNKVSKEVEKLDKDDQVEKPEFLGKDEISQGEKGISISPDLVEESIESKTSTEIEQPKISSSTEAVNEELEIHQQNLQNIPTGQGKEVHTRVKRSLLEDTESNLVEDSQEASSLKSLSQEKLLSLVDQEAEIPSISKSELEINEQKLDIVSDLQEEVIRDSDLKESTEIIKDEINKSNDYLEQSTSSSLHEMVASVECVTIKDMDTEKEPKKSDTKVVSEKLETQEDLESETPEKQEYKILDDDIESKATYSKESVQSAKSDASGDKIHFPSGDESIVSKTIEADVEASQIQVDNAESPLKSEVQESLNTSRKSSKVEGALDTDFHNIEAARVAEQRDEFQGSHDSLNSNKSSEGHGHEIFEVVDEIQTGFRTEIAKSPEAVFIHDETTASTDAILSSEILDTSADSLEIHGVVTTDTVDTPDSPDTVVITHKSEEISDETQSLKIDRRPSKGTEADIDIEEKSNKVKDALEPGLKSPASTLLSDSQIIETVGQASFSLISGEEVHKSEVSESIQHQFEQPNESVPSRSSVTDKKEEHDGEIEISFPRDEIKDIATHEKRPSIPEEILLPGSSEQDAQERSSTATPAEVLRSGSPCKQNMTLELKEFHEVISQSQISDFQSQEIEQQEKSQTKEPISVKTEQPSADIVQAEKFDVVEEISKDANQPILTHVPQEEVKDVKGISIESRIESMRKEGGRGWIETESEVPEETEEEIDTIQKDIATAAKEEADAHQGEVESQRKVPSTTDTPHTPTKSPLPETGVDEISAKEIITEPKPAVEGEFSQKSEIDESAKFDISVKYDETRSDSTKETSPDSLRTDELDLALEQHRRRLSAANEESIKSRIGEETSQDEINLTDDGKDQVDIETSRESQFGSLNEDDRPIDDFPIGDDVLEIQTGEDVGAEEAQTPVQIPQLELAEVITTSGGTQFEENENILDIPSPTSKPIELDDKIELPVGMLPSASGIATASSEATKPNTDTADESQGDHLEKLDDEIKISAIDAKDLDGRKMSIKSTETVEEFGTTKNENKEVKEVETDRKEIETESKENKVLPVQSEPEPPSPAKSIEPPVSVKPQTKIEEATGGIPETRTSFSKPIKSVPVPSAIPPKIPRESREVIRTPDEVADLPVHEEVEPGTYETDFFHENRKDEKMDTDEDIVTSDFGDQMEQSAPGMVPEPEEEEKLEEIVSAATGTGTATAPFTGITGAGPTFTTSSITHTTKDEESPAPGSDDFRILSHDDKVTKSEEKPSKDSETSGVPDQIEKSEVEQDNKTGEKEDEIRAVHSLPPGVVEKIDAAVSPVLESLLTKSVGGTLERKSEVVETMESSAEVALADNEKCIEDNDAQLPVESKRDESGYVDSTSATSPGKIGDFESARVESDKYSTTSPTQLLEKVESGTMQTKELEEDGKEITSTLVKSPSGLGDESVDAPPPLSLELKEVEEKDEIHGYHHQPDEKTEQIAEQRKDEGLKGEIELEKPQTDEENKESIPFVHKPTASITSVVITPSTPPVQVVDDGVSLFPLPPQIQSGDSTEQKIPPEEKVIFVHEDIITRDDNDNASLTGGRLTPEDLKLTSDVDITLTREEIVESKHHPTVFKSDEKLFEEIPASDDKFVTERKLSTEENLTSGTKVTSNEDSDEIKPADDYKFAVQNQKNAISEEKTENKVAAVAEEASSIDDKLIDTEVNNSSGSSGTSVRLVTTSNLLVEEAKMSTSEESSSSSALTAIVETTKEIISSITKTDVDASDQLSSPKSTSHVDVDEKDNISAIQTTSEVNKSESSEVRKSSSSEVEIIEEKREKLFFLPRDEDDDDENDNEDEGVGEDVDNNEIESISGLGLVQAGLLNAANTLNAPVVHQSTEDIAIIQTSERQRSPEGGSSSPQKSEEPIKIKADITLEKSEFESELTQKSQEKSQAEIVEEVSSNANTISLETGHILQGKVDADKSSSKFHSGSEEDVVVTSGAEDKSVILKPDDHKEPGSEDEMEFTGKTLVSAIGGTITPVAGVILSMMGSGQEAGMFAKSQEEKSVKVLFSDISASEISTGSQDSEEPISETLLQTAHSAVSTALESATETIQVAESTVDEVQKSAQEKLNSLLQEADDVVDKSSEVVEESLLKSQTIASQIEESFTSKTTTVQECSKAVGHVADKICESMKTVHHEGTCSHDSDDDGLPEVVEELCTKTILPPRVIRDDNEDEKQEESGKKSPEEVIKSAMKTIHHETPDDTDDQSNVEANDTINSSKITSDTVVTTLRSDEDVMADLEDQMMSDTFGFVIESKTTQDDVHVQQDQPAVVTKTTETITFVKDGQSGDPGQIKSPIIDTEEPITEEAKSSIGDDSITQQIEVKEQPQKKRKELTDYIGTIKEAKAVFDTLLNVAKSGAALSSAVEECKQNAVDAIRRHLEEANEVYRPVNRDPVAPDSPVEEEGITIYESLEQMALAGSELFTGLVEKIEKDIEEKAQREEDDTPETPDEAQRRLSAELAVNAALQHLHETFKTMQTMGSPKRSSFHAATCKRQSRLATSGTTGDHQEEEDDMRSASSGRFSQSAMTSSLHLSTSATLAESSTIKSPDDETERSEGETMRESMASFTSGVGSDVDDRAEFMGSSVTESVTFSQDSETEKVEGHSSEWKVKEEVSGGISSFTSANMTETQITKGQDIHTESREQKIISSSEAALTQGFSSSTQFKSSEKSELISSREISSEEAKSQHEFISSEYEASGGSKQAQEELFSSKSATTTGSSSSSYSVGVTKDAKMSSASEVMELGKSILSSSEKEFFSSSLASNAESSNITESSSITIGERESSRKSSAGGGTVMGSETPSESEDMKEETTRKVVYYEEKSGEEPSSLKTVTTTTTSVSPGGSVTKTTLNRRFSSSGEPLEDIADSPTALKFTRRASEVQGSQFTGAGSMSLHNVFDVQQPTQPDTTYHTEQKKGDDSGEIDPRPQSDFGYQTRESGDEESGSYQSAQNYSTMIAGGSHHAATSGEFESSKVQRSITEEVYNNDPLRSTTFRTVTDDFPDGFQKLTTVRTVTTTGGFENLSDFQKSGWTSSDLSTAGGFEKSTIVQTEGQGSGSSTKFQRSTTAGGTTTREVSSDFPGFGKSTIIRTVSEDSSALPDLGRSIITRTVSEDSSSLPGSGRSTVIRTVSEGATRNFPDFEKSNITRTVTTTSGSGSDDSSGITKSSTTTSSSTSGGGSQQHQQYYPAFPQDILEEEAYSSGDFSDSQPSSVPTGHVETDDEVHNFEQSSSKGDLDNGNYSSTTVVTSDNGSVTTQTSVTSVSTGDNGNTVTQTTRVVTTSRTVSDDPNFTSSEVVTSETQEASGTSSTASTHSDILKEWGKPLGLPVVYTEGAEGGSNGPDSGNFGGKATPKKTPGSSKGPGTPAKSASGSSKEKRSSSRKSRHSPIYVDLAYVPHHGNSHYCDSEFFRMIRGRYYVFSGLEPSREVFEGLLEGKQQWEDKNLETTVIPTYDTDTLGYWVGDSEKELAEAKIDLAPSASRCTINLQDHETSCAAYRLEF